MTTKSTAPLAPKLRKPANEILAWLAKMPQGLDLPTLSSKVKAFSNLKTKEQEDILSYFVARDSVDIDTDNFGRRVLRHYKHRAPEQTTTPSLPAQTTDDTVDKIVEYIVAYLERTEKTVSKGDFGTITKPYRSLDTTQRETVFDQLRNHAAIVALTKPSKNGRSGEVTHFTHINHAPEGAVTTAQSKTNDVVVMEESDTLNPAHAEVLKTLVETPDETFADDENYALAGTSSLSPAEQIRAAVASLVSLVDTAQVSLTQDTQALELLEPRMEAVETAFAAVRSLEQQQTAALAALALNVGALRNVITGLRKNADPSSK